MIIRVIINFMERKSIFVDFMSGGISGPRPSRITFDYYCVIINFMDRKSVIVDFMSGGISGVVSKTICAPLERVKLLMQTASSNSML